MKKFRISLVSVLLLALLVGGISNLWAKGSADKPSGPIEVTLLSRWAEDSPQSNLFRARIDEFNAKNTDIKIVGEFISDEPAFLDKLRTSFATGHQYDIYWGYGGAREADYAVNGLLVDLEPVKKANPVWAEKFIPGLDDKWKYPDVKGTFGVIGEMYSIAVFYNEDIFNKAGLKPPKSIAEFETVSDALLKQGIIPMALGAKDAWRTGHVFNNFVMKTFGSAGVDALAKRTIAYDSPEIKAIFSKIAEYNKRGYFGPNAVGVDYNQEKSLFQQGKTAMHMDGSWYLGEIAAYSNVDSYNVMSFPYMNAAFKGSWFGSGGGWSVCRNKDKAHEAAAVKALMYITDMDFYSRAIIANKGGIQPVKIKESDIKGAEISSISKKYMVALSEAKDLRDDVQTYDPLPSMLDTARIALQGLFVGKTADDVALEIVTEIKNRAK